MLTQIPDPVLRSAPSPGQTRGGGPEVRRQERAPLAQGSSRLSPDSATPRCCPSGGGPGLPRRTSARPSLVRKRQPAVRRSARTPRPSGSGDSRRNPGSSSKRGTPSHVQEEQHGRNVRTGLAVQTGLRASRETHGTHCPRRERHSGLPQGAASLGSAAGLGGPGSGAHGLDCGHRRYIHNSVIPRHEMTRRQVCN